MHDVVVIFADLFVKLMGMFLIVFQYMPYLALYFPRHVVITQDSDCPIIGAIFTNPKIKV